MRDWRRVVGFVLAPFLMVLMMVPSHGIAADPFDGVRQLIDGGKHRDAAIAVTKVLNSGTLSPADTARGFYLRGASYAKTNKHPQAISDLTNAIWLNGLSKQERVEAYRLRATAYQATGNQSKAAADLKKAGSPEANLAQGLSTTVNRTPTPQPAALTPIETTTTRANPAPATSGWNAQTASASAAQPAPKPAASNTSGGSAVSNFFNGIFNSGAASATGTPASSASALNRDDAVTVASNSAGSAATSRPGSTVSVETGGEWLVVPGCIHSCGCTGPPYHPATYPGGSGVLEHSGCGPTCSKATCRGNSNDDRDASRSSGTVQCSDCDCSRTRGCGSDTAEDCGS